MNDIDIIRQSKLFDENFYVQNYHIDSSSPIEHYLNAGWKLGYNPSKKFDNNFYLDANLDVKKAGINPLLHFIKYGMAEDRKYRKADNNDILQSKLFNTRFYTKTYNLSISNPIEHYLTIGWKLGYNPSKKFDGNFYLDIYPEVKETGMNPLLHFIYYGQKEGRLSFEKKFKESRPSILDKSICFLKKKNPLISIIVASYNYQDFIQETLNSLLCQTYKNFEIIVVDDGSTDNSVNVIKKYARKHNNIHLYTHENHTNKGLAETLHLGLSKAKGEWIAFCESDDFWAPTHLEEKVKIINSYANPKIIINDIHVFGDETRKKESLLYYNTRCKPYFFRTKNKISILSFRETNRIPTFSCCMVKKDILNKCDFKSSATNVIFDWYLWRQVCAVYPVYYVNNKLTFWRASKNSQTVASELNSIRYRELQRKRGDIALLKQHPWKAHCLWKYDINRYRHKPYFSVIMPTYNRAFCICDSIDSLLQQTYQNFELIIVDDGSTDGTEDLLKEHYSEEIASGKIRYYYKKNSGTSAARNYGLNKAKHDWITYLDTDNELVACALEKFALNICLYPNYLCFYGIVYYVFGKQFFGIPFNYKLLKLHNYIDMGVFAHKRILYQKIGGFDENMDCLEDWDLILRYTKKHPAKFITNILLLYNDSNEIERMSNQADFSKMTAYEQEKNEQKQLHSIAKRMKIVHKLFRHDDNKSILLFTQELSLTEMPISLFWTIKYLKEHAYKITLLSLKNGPLEDKFKELGIDVVIYSEKTPFKLIVEAVLSDLAVYKICKSRKTDAL